MFFIACVWNVLSWKSVDRCPQNAHSVQGTQKSQCHREGAWGMRGKETFFGLPLEILRCWLYLLVFAKKRVYTVQYLNAQRLCEKGWWVNIRALQAAQHLSQLFNSVLVRKEPEIVNKRADWVPLKFIYRIWISYKFDMSLIWFFKTFFNHLNM